MRWSQPPIRTERKTSLSSKWFAKRKSRHKLKNEIKKRRHWKPFNCRNREKSQQGQLGRGSRTDGCTYTYTHVVLVLCNCYLGKKIQKEPSALLFVISCIWPTHEWVRERPRSPSGYRLSLLILLLLLLCHQGELPCDTDAWWEQQYDLWMSL